ncbi:DUF4233 domain-containing protein [Marinitenerispora sediminis]|uniref:DUF4233 domain-containing protein n=1 Tax=Marinitenerispora sediminis TaxID=1931232 RepID=A0A368T173_9ACTN|nr:DUF4233 domain-containing protein [Marinitenerispora sediminis]RCV50446.1 DUF4233 domain-containing protein [Marinitenerispora sediminis]RCV53730.1 DUF4233 domain-containing protein [Marinitenerispora sediminis]RCV53902.1 DUF4233 domain-containing protein [Marinitenerispora sediminis]
MRTMCAVVLAFEAVVIALAVPVAIQLGGYSPAVAGGVWGGLAAAALVLAALQRFAWGHYAGWVLQAAFVVSGVLVPGLFVLGIVFAALWVAGVWLGRRTDAIRAAREAGASAGAGTGAAEARRDG